MPPKNTPKNPANELHLTRFYKAPVKAVWDAWTDPQQVAQWWGPRGFKVTTHSKDLRPGGSWVYTMHGPDGVDYPNNTLYFEVEPFKRLVYDHGANDERPALFRVTVDFTEVGGGTKMDMRMILPTPEAAQETKRFIKKAGGNSTWDRLAEYLAKTTADKEQFVINRSFDAPIDLVFEMWTNPKHVAHWLPPTGFTMQFIHSEIRPGSTTFYCITGGQIKMYGKAHYLEIKKPHLIVYTQQFADENGHISRHPLAPIWPETMLTTVQLTEEDDAKTRVTITWECHGKVSAAELKTFIEARTGMTGGWTGSFDKLEAYLPSQL